MDEAGFDDVRGRRSAAVHRHEALCDRLAQDAMHCHLLAATIRIEAIMSSEQACRTVAVSAYRMADAMLAARKTS